MLETLGTPSVYTLRSTNYLIASTLKNDGLDVPIQSYMYKSRGEELTDVTVIGIKDGTSIPDEDSHNPVIGMSIPLASAVISMMIPESAIRITPILIFRKLYPINRQLEPVDQQT